MQKKYQIKKKSIIVSALSDSKIFLLFAFVNSCFPIFFCIIASFISNYGSQAVMAVGYVAPFQLAFMQLGVSFATWTFYSLIKKKIHNQKTFKKLNFDETISSSIYISIFIGIIVVAFYVGCSYAYMYFSTNRPNTMMTLNYGYDYIYSTVGYLFLTCLKSILVMYIYNYYKNQAFYFELGFTIITLVLVFLLGVLTNLGTTGMGLGSSVAILVYLLFLIWFIYRYCPFKFYRFNFHSFKTMSVFKDVLKESSVPISMPLFKGIALLMLGLVIPGKLNGYIPLSYQMSRVLWFNMMYALPFIAVGIATSIEFYDLYNINKNKIIRKRKYWLFVIIAMSLTVILAIGGRFMTKPLTELYIQNHNITNQMLPPIPIGMPIDINNLPPSSLPNIPDSIYNASSKEELAKAIYEWLKTPEMKKWADWIISNPKLELWLLNPANQSIFSQWLVDYISYTTLDVNITEALLHYRSSEAISKPNSIVLLSLTFNAKAYIYICVYSILCSGWTVLLPATTRVARKKMPNLLVIFVYAISIAFVITFGIIFSLYFSDWLPNSNNPFKYLDAWTFPVFVVSILVSAYIWTKWIIVNIKDYRLRDVRRNFLISV